MKYLISYDLIGEKADYDAVEDFLTKTLKARRFLDSQWVFEDESDGKLAAIALKYIVSLLTKKPRILIVAFDPASAIGTDNLHTPISEL